MKLVSKKLTLGLGCAVAALTFTACGGGVPDCDDSDVQDAVKKAYLEAFLQDEFFDELTKGSKGNKESKKFAKQADDLFKKELKLEMSSFTTERVDEKRNRVVCQARISGDMHDSKVQEGYELLDKALASVVTLRDNEVMSDGKFDEFIKKNYKSSNEYDKHVRKIVENVDKELHNNPHNLEYTARRTEDGKLLVEVENGLPSRNQTLFSLFDLEK